MCNVEFTCRQQKYSERCQLERNNTNKTKITQNTIKYFI